MDEEEGKDKHYIGFDFSTQQVKAVVVNNCLEVIAEEHVNFDKDLPEFRTHGGVHINGTRVTAPTVMWVKALDMILDKLRVAGVDFSTVDGISGVGQQHGSVYWKNGVKQVFANLQPENFLYDQLAGSFSLLDSPIWMDSSTSEECKMLEESVGGAERLAEITGSRAYERFTGSQIAKFRKERPDAYQNTERISLVSSFAASLFLGDIAPIDWSDAGGMNILDIKSKQWSQELVDAICPDLSEKLGDPVFGSTIVGCVSTYMQERYGFKENCQIVAFTGDNPGSLAGLALGENDIGLSLGTSDTLFIWLKDAQPQLTGHVWPNPIEESAYMALLCYKNGSLTRERIRDSKAEGRWDLFNELLDATPRGNFGNIGMYFDHEEIIPRGIKGDYRFNKSGANVERFGSAEAEVRALVEGQMMAKRIHAENIGLVMNQDTRILVTGGGSVNSNILQVISDVFDAPVLTQTGANSAALGGAYRALHVCSNQGNEKQYKETVDGVRASAQLTCHPNKDAKKVYDGLTERYKQLEAQIKLQFNI